MENRVQKRAKTLADIVDNLTNLIDVRLEGEDRDKVVVLCEALANVYPVFSAEREHLQELLEQQEEESDDGNGNSGSGPPTLTEP